MKSRPILFEDHGLARLRPLSWSVPQFEVRCGMFALRERVALLTRDRGGCLFMRGILRDLASAQGWTIGFVDGSGCADVWLAGRLGPRWDILEGLLALPPETPDFLWRDGHGLVAARLSPARSRALADLWTRWEAAATATAAWTTGKPLPVPWDVAAAFPEFPTTAGLHDQELLVDAAADPAARGALAEAWKGWVVAGPATLDWIWDVAPRTASALNGDLAALAGGRTFARAPFGLVSQEEAPLWTLPSLLVPAAQRFTASARLPDFGPGCDLDRLLLGQGVHCEPGLVVDTRSGPVVLDNGVQVMAHSRLEGPLYLGPGCIVKPGARVFGHSSFGIGNRIAGEIGESTFGDFVNKQHDGFIGHAVLGSWVNLGAMTTCSDLKNNYGRVRVDLGWGPQPTGQQFVGLLCADHVKTAIGTLLNTGTVVGFAANLFGVKMPPKCVENFSWGGQPDDPAYGVTQALATAAAVMARRGCELSQAHAALFRSLARQD